MVQHIPLRTALYPAFSRGQRQGSTVCKDVQLNIHMTFDELGLSQNVLDAVTAAGYENPTEIQKSAIPPALKGRDVLGLAQTGTGKTAAFALPILTKLEKGRARARMPRSLILEPTRELAAQVADAIDIYARNHKITVALLIGGVSFGDQDKKIDRGADIVIATPGRLLDHFERGKLMLTAIETLVVDEADRMLDMGFIPDIERIFNLTPFTRQTLFFSATMPKEIQHITDTFLHNPVRVEASPPSSTASTIEQKLVRVSHTPRDKRAAFRALLDSLDIKNAIVFSNRKRDVGVLQRSMVKHGYDAVALHGDMDQSARMAALARFRDGEVKYLIASDVAARGLDIPSVSHIFNFDVPSHAEDYVHRIGRTGRAGREGHAFTLVTGADKRQLAAIEKLIDKDINWLDMPAETRTDDKPDGTERKTAPDSGKSESGSRNRRKSRPPREQKTGTRRKSSKAENAAPSSRQPQRKPRPSRPDDSPKQDVVGMGEHTPAFLLRPVRHTTK